MTQINKILLLIVVTAISVCATVDFKSAVSLSDCKSIAKCGRGLILNGSWESKGFDNVRCDGFGCWNMYNDACKSASAELFQKMEALPNQNIWGKIENYYEDGYPSEILNLIQMMAQFEIDCFEKQPKKVSRLGKNARVYERCLDKAFQNCSTVKGFTKEYSVVVLSKAKELMDHSWNMVAAAQKQYQSGVSPRNLSLLGGDFAWLERASFDEYHNFLIEFIKKERNLPRPKMRTILTSEKDLLLKSKMQYEKDCLDLERASIESIDLKTKKCNDFSMTREKNAEFEKNKVLRLNTIEKELYTSALNQQKKEPLQALSKGSKLKEYLVKYPNGLYSNDARNLLEATLAQEGFKEASLDTAKGLSEESLLYSYLTKFSNGKYRDSVVTFLEKMFYYYSLSQIKNNPQASLQDDGYPEQYLKKYPEGKYRDSMLFYYEKAYWLNYSSLCLSNNTVDGCRALFVYPHKFSNGIHLDSCKKMIDNPMWTSIKTTECVYPEDSVCSEIEGYVHLFPNGKYKSIAEKILSNALKKRDEREAEQQRLADIKEKSLTWINTYNDLQVGCTFISKKDSYAFEWSENNSFPEKNGTIECVDKKDLSLDSIDTLSYKCIETNRIVVKNGKVVGGKGTCINAMNNPLINRTFLSNGKNKATMSFPEQITLSLNENGVYTIHSPKKKLTNLDFNMVMRIYSFIEKAKNLSYLYEVDNVEIEWTKSGQIKNIRIKEFNSEGKILGKVNIPLNAVGEMHGITEVYTGSTGSFKIEWNKGKFKRVFGGGKNLKSNLCPSYVCSNQIDKLLENSFIYHNVPSIESTRDMAERGLEEGWMLHYIAFLLGLTLNDALYIWNSL